MASSCSGVSRLPNAGMSVSGFTASGSDDPAAQRRRIVLGADVRELRPVLAAVAVDDVAADAVARPHAGRASRSAAGSRGTAGA